MWCWPPPPCQTFVICTLPFLAHPFLSAGSHNYVINHVSIQCFDKILFVFGTCWFLFKSWFFPFFLTFTSICFLSFLFVPSLLSCPSLLFYAFLALPYVSFGVFSFLPFFPFCFFRSRGILKTHDKVTSVRISVQAPISWHCCSET